MAALERCGQARFCRRTSRKAFISCARCKKHFSVMLKNYTTVLRSRGRILTCQIGMDAYHDELGCTMTYADLISLESHFPVLVSKLNDVVYALTKEPS